MVNLNDLVDGAIILAVAFYLMAVVATELFDHWRRPWGALDPQKEGEDQDFGPNHPCKLC
jgi:hypothetical protein